MRTLTISSNGKYPDGINQVSEFSGYSSDPEELLREIGYDLDIYIHAVMRKMDELKK